MQQKVPPTVTVTIPRWFSITSVPLEDIRLAKVNDKFEESRRKSTSSLQKFTGLEKQTWLIDDFRTSDSFFSCLMNLHWQGQTGPEILMKAGVWEIEWLKQKVRAKEFHAWLLWSMLYTIYLHLWSHVYSHGISRNICTPKEAAWGRCGWYCSPVWPCSLASRWIRQTWRRRGQKKQGWHLTFKSVEFIFHQFSWYFT